MAEKTSLKQKATTLFDNVRYYWKEPPKGRYMPFKEVGAYSVGGIGVYFLIGVVQAFLINVNNFLIANVIGIDKSIILVIYVISVIVGFPATALRANIIDNTRNRQGKYRPYIMSMGIPTAILAVGFILVPYEKIHNDWISAIIILFFNIGFQFFYCFYLEAYENLLYVLSPNTQERADVASIKSIVYSIAPTISTAIMPLAAAALTGGSMTNIKLYRCVYPPMAIVGILLSVVVYANTQEKIIQAKTHVVQIKFMDALRAVAKNKYFWIISFAGWLGFLEGFYAVVLQWLYQYQHACSPGVYTIIGMINGNAYFWGMLAAPFAIRKFGKKKVLIFTNILNIFFIAMMYPVIVANPNNMIWIILICLFMNNLANSFGHILNPSIQGDIRDYQQYVTGERIDGMFATVGLIGSLITLATSGILPLVYDKTGINKATLAKLGPSIISQESAWIRENFAGETEKINELVGNLQQEVANVDFAVLYNRDVFEAVMLALIGISVLGAAINVIPFFFYDLSEIKQRGMVNILKIRAMFEDFGNGVLTDRNLVETIDIIRESSEMYDKEPVSTDKKDFTGKGKRKARREAIEYNNKIEIAKIVMLELKKFDDDPVFQIEFERAKKIYAAGLSGLTEVDDNILKEAKALPKNTKEERKIRSKAIESARNRLYAKKVIMKNYGGKIEEFDASVFEPLFEKDDACNDAMTAAYANLHNAKKAKDADAVAKFKAEIKILKNEQKQINAQIKDATDKNSVYSRAAKPYLDAKKLLVQEENYKRYDEIDSVYEEAKLRAENQAKAEAEERARLEAEEKAELEKRKAEKKAKSKKSNKK